MGIFFGIALDILFLPLGITWGLVMGYYDPLKNRPKIMLLDSKSSKDVDIDAKK